MWVYAHNWYFGAVINDFLFVGAKHVIKYSDVFGSHDNDQISMNFFGKPDG